jgi:Raf kinase inhibitor-like YbhB/YbcL family protein
MIRLLSILAAASCAGVLAGSVTAAGRFALTSPAFRSGRMIPRRYTCDGVDLSPPLHWSTPPARTRSLAIQVIDLDAHRLRHWLAWGLPATTHMLAAGQHPPHQAINSFGDLGYGGPCPPSGRHRYQFDLYALNAPTGPPFTGHVLAIARLTGVYGR